MLYEVILPDETQEILEELTNVQISILELALEISYLGKPDWKESFKELFEEKLKAHSDYCNYYLDVAKWLYDKPTLFRKEPTNTSPIGLLFGFLEGHQGVSSNCADLYQEKQWLLQAMRRDIDRLANGHVESFEAYLDASKALPAKLQVAQRYITQHASGRGDKRPDWLKALVNYLLYFYEDMGGETGIQHNIFRHRTENYSRQNFLIAYRSANHGLVVCPMCDNAAFLTISSKDHHHADIEHYFPKDIYPHLAIHPYNLIPVCKLCNQAIKRDIDPLAPDQEGGSRYSLGDLFLPYRSGRALSNATVLRIHPLTATDQNELTDDDYIFHLARDGSSQKERLKSARIALHVRADDGRDLTKHFKLFSRIYDIPGRWEQQVDEICDMFFRRIRQLFADNIVLEPDSLDSIKLIENKLNWLLVFLDETSGSDRYTFLMKWWLAELIVRYLNQDPVETQNPLLDEIQSWKDDFDSSREMYAKRVILFTNEIRTLMNNAQ